MSPRLAPLKGEYEAKGEDGKVCVAPHLRSSLLLSASHTPQLSYIHILLLLSPHITSPCPHADVLLWHAAPVPSAHRPPIPGPCNAACTTFLLPVSSC